MEQHTAIHTHEHTHGHEEHTHIESKILSPLTAAVITVSDKGYRGERKDLGGPLTAQILTENGYQVIYQTIVPDEQMMIEAELRKCADELCIDFVATTGGTGFSLRDVTPEATLAVCDRMVPGIAEAMRAESYKITKKAMLSRAASGLRKKTLIINLPGSPKAVKENLEAILPTLEHGIRILKGEDGECGAPAATK